MIVSEEMQGKEIYLKAYKGSSYYIAYYDSKKQLISTNYNNWQNVGTDRWIVSIPQNTYYISFYVDLWEIMPYTAPKINTYNIYPIVTASAVEKECMNISINYFQTAVKKQYKIDDGEWQMYINPIKLTVGQKITARSINQYGEISMESTYTVSMAPDAISAVTYDGNESTIVYSSNSGGYMKISEEMQGGEIYLKAYKGSYYYIAYYDSQKQLISTNYNNWQNVGQDRWIVPIPQNTYYISFYIDLWEVKPYKVTSSSVNINSVRGNQGQEPQQNVDEQKQLIESPRITLDNITDYAVSKVVTINYVDGYRNEYSLDATNWNSYTGPVNITEKGTTIYARSIDESGKVVSSSSYKITKISRNEEINNVSEQNENNNIPEVNENQNDNKAIEEKKEGEENEETTSEDGTSGQQEDSEEETNEEVTGE